MVSSSVYSFLELPLVENPRSALGILIWHLVM